MIEVRRIEEQKTPEQGGGSYFRIHDEDVKKIPKNHFGSCVINGKLCFMEDQKEADQHLPKPPPLDPNYKEEKLVALTDDEQIKLRALLAAQEASQLNSK